MTSTKSINVPHLGGITAGYQMPHPYDTSKPTLVMVNSFTTSSDLYRSQYENKALTDSMNLLAIELLGHGQTRTKSENFTYWDTAIMNLQVMEALKVKKAFVLGTSQGGWITVRMALLAPDKVRLPILSLPAQRPNPALKLHSCIYRKHTNAHHQIQGIIPLGTSMDFESERTRKLGCWDGVAACTGPIDQWTTTASTPDFHPDENFCNFLIDIGFGKNCGDETRTFWTKTIQSNYQGDEGRRRARMAAINLRERDGLHGRLFDVVCPVLWLHVSIHLSFVGRTVPVWRLSPGSAWTVS